MRARHSAAVRWHRLLLALALVAQCGLALQGVGDMWTRGHNGWNGAAYHNSARNSLRWGVVFPLQYETANHPPEPAELYTHAPLALHLHHVAAYRLFGDHEASIRGVAAVYALLVVLALYVVVSRLWSPAIGAVTAAIYVALPINAIYTNMPNHTGGFIVWILVALYLFVRSREAAGWNRCRFAAFLAAFALAALWDWPAYHVAFVLATWWGICLVVDKKHERARPGDAMRLGIFCVWTLALFFGHFGLVEWWTGNLAELQQTFEARSDMKWSEFKRHVRTVPPIMFTWGVLLTCVGWLLAWLFRNWKGPRAHRDVIPLAFAFAAIVHFIVFRRSAVAHSYWAWPALPFAAIALATTVAALWGRVRDADNTTGSGRHRLAAVAGFAVILVVLGLLGVRDAAIVPKARYVGGSLWFFLPVRAMIDTYDSGRPELRLATHARSWTDRETAFQLHPSFKPRRPEPRFEITLDRPIKKWFDRFKPSEPLQEGSSSWAYLAVKSTLTESARLEYARRYRYRELGEFAFVDARYPGPDVEIWRGQPQPKSWSTTFFGNTFETDVTFERVPHEEAEFLRRLSATTTGRAP